MAFDTSQALSIQAARTIDVGRGSGGGLVGDWQLPTANYQPTLIEAELIFPRPDNETPVWAKHRRHPIGIKYEIPIGVANGSWPFYFEPVSVPSGSTIGQQLTVSGDTLIPSSDYGVVTWDNPSAGTHTFSYLVRFQDGTTPIAVSWTLEVTDTGIIYCDQINGNDTTGDGSIGNPLATIDGWFKADNTDRTFSGFQVCYRAGTYDVVTSDPATTGNLRLNYFNKPLVHFAYPGESVVWDFDLGNFTTDQSAGGNPGGEVHFSDWFIGGITCSGGPQAASGRRWNVNAGASGAFPYDGSGGGMRCTWFRSPQVDWTYAGDSSNNSAIVFGADTGSDSLTRSHWYVTRSPITNITGSGTNFNGWFIGNVSRFLAEHIKVTNTNFGRGPFSGKSSEFMSCYRNIDCSDAPNQGFNYDNAGSYAPTIGGGNEVSYCRINDQSTATVATALVSGHHNNTYNAAEQYHLPNYHFRNSVSKSPATAGRTFRTYGGWPVYVYDDIWCSEGDGTYINGPVNTRQDGGWLLYPVASNPFDASLNLVTERLSNLGIKGAEVSL